MGEIPGIQWHDAIGIVGVVLYIGNYTFLQLRLLNASGHNHRNFTLYSSVNLTAASLLLVSLSQDFNLAAALIQGAWVLISTVGLLVRWRSRPRRRVRRGKPPARRGGAQPAGEPVRGRAARSAPA